MYRPVALLLLLQFSFVVYAQDSTTVLREIQVQAYRYNRSIADVPVSVAVLGQSDFSKFDNSSLLQASNIVPGVRMEERSPGSYRFSIRGSLIRSPFGVRNVKVYWDGLPLTDGGGNTYLNVLDPTSIGSLEIIKGPGGSLYGANTGGVILMKSRTPRKRTVEAAAMTGSYGLNRANFRGEILGNKSNGSVGFAHQNSDGYRDHTRFRRDVANTDWSFAVGKATVVSSTIFATDVYYQTPGGLTKAEYEASPRDARPAAGPLKSAEEQKASVRNKGVFGGVNASHDWNDSWSSQLGVFGSYNDFENFAIRNYERRYETNLGARLENYYAFGDDTKGGKVTFGAEAIYFMSPINVYGNLSGTIGDQQIDDDVTSEQYLVFLQTEFFLPHGFSLTAAASSNFLNYSFDRTFPVVDDREKSFSAVITPRVAVMKKIGEHVAVFASASKGFSPPTLAEVRPSTNTFNDELKPESGVSYEVGIKGGDERFGYELSAYRFNLKETIVLQRLVDGAEYFTNAGETMQRGIEISGSWKPGKTVKLWSSYSYNHYRFVDYVKYDQPTGMDQDYSGNKMTGVPPTTFSIGADVNIKRIYFNATTAYTDHIPLNDANAEYASEYFLLGLRVGYRKNWTNGMGADFFCGGNNLLDEKYSLGNDLNAVNGRYYNVAPDRNFYVGASFTFSGKQ
jgi:iron complex outermembrane recepter protein